MKNEIRQARNVIISFAEKVFYFNKRNIVLAEMRKKEAAAAKKMVKDFYHKLYYGF